jgi:hypothetical protein
MDPTGVIPYDQPQPRNPLDAAPAPSSDVVTLSTLLQSQLRLVKKLQDQLNRGGVESLEPREVKEYLSSITTILTLAHRTEDLVKELKTYQQFRDVVIDWARSRSDGLGEDLVEALRQHAEQFRQDG